MDDESLERLNLEARLNFGLQEALDINRFQEDHPTLTETLPLPPMTWAQVERQLTRLALVPERQARVAAMVLETRTLARVRPPEMVLRDILIMAWLLLDEEPIPPLEPEEDAMD